MKKQLLAVLFPLLIILSACNSTAPNNQESAQDESNKENTVEEITEDENKNNENSEEKKTEQENNQDGSNEEETNKESNNEKQQNGIEKNKNEQFDGNKDSDQRLNGREGESKKDDSEDRPNDDIEKAEVSLEDALYQYLYIDVLSAYELENEAITAYESVTGANYTDDPTTLQVLVEDVIPVYTEFVEELKVVEIDNPELKSLHDMYIQGAEKQLEAFYIFAEGIEKQNLSLVNEGNIILAEGVELINEYVSQVQTLASEYGL